MTTPNAYDLKSVKLPRMAGGTLKAFVALLDNATMRALLLPQLLASAGITGWRKSSVDDAPTFQPLAPMPAKELGAPVDLSKRIAPARRRPRKSPSASSTPSPIATHENRRYARSSLAIATMSSRRRAHRPSVGATASH